MKEQDIVIIKKNHKSQIETVSKCQSIESKQNVIPVQFGKPLGKIFEIIANVPSEIVYYI